jgi:ankyrin repeat protein
VLLDASASKSLKMLKRLLALGVDADARDDQGTTALMMTCDLPECHDHCKALIDAGADVHAQRQMGEKTVQALHIACFKGAASQMKLLLKAGAHVSSLAASPIKPSSFSPHGEGATCLMRAVCGNRSKLI